MMIVKQIYNRIIQKKSVLRLNIRLTEMKIESLQKFDMKDCVCLSGGDRKES